MSGFDQATSIGPLREVSPIVDAMAHTQFDDCVKKVRIFVAPHVREQIPQNLSIDDLVLEVIELKPEFASAERVASRDVAIRFPDELFSERRPELGLSVRTNGTVRACEVRSFLTFVRIDAVLSPGGFLPFQCRRTCHITLDHGCDCTPGKTELLAFGQELLPQDLFSVFDPPEFGPEPAQRSSC